MELTLAHNNEIALTPRSSPGQALALSHRMGEGIFRSKEHQMRSFSYPRPLAGEGRVRVPFPPCTCFQRRAEDTKGLGNVVRTS